MNKITTSTLGVIFTGLVGLTGPGLSNPEKAQEQLEAAGYTNIKITGRGWWIASAGITRSSFTGQNSEGKCVKGIVGSDMRHDTIILTNECD